MNDFYTLLEARLNEKYAENRQHLADGVPLFSQEPQKIAIDYAKRVGYLEGLRDVRDVCKEIIRKLNGET